MPVRHGWLLERLQSGVQGSGVVASEGANTVRPKDRHKEMEFALVDKLIEGLKKRMRVNGGVIGRYSDKQRNSRLGKGVIKSGLGV